MTGGGWIAELACATIDGALKTTVLVAATAAWLRLARPADPRVRSKVWAATLLAALSIPIAAVALPASGPGWLPAPVVVDAGGGAAPVAPRGPREHRIAGPAPTVVPSPGAGIALATADRPTLDWTAAWVTIWAGVAFGLLAFRALGIGRLHRAVRRPAIDPGETAREALRAAASRIGVDPVPDLVVTDLVAGPATCGFRRATIVLPPVAVTWNAERLDLVLRHELAHVRRGDWLLRQVLHVACALYWFQPLVWWVARRVAEEQEFACDREVVDSGARPSSYARHLIEVARAAVRPAAMTVPALEMARHSRMEDRLMAVLEDRTTARRTRRVLPPLLLTLLLVPALGAVRTWSGPSRDATPPVEVDAAQAADGSNRARIGALAVEIDSAIEEMEAAAGEIERLVAAEIEPVTEEIERRMAADVEPLQAELDAVVARMEPIAREIERIHEQELQAALEAAERRRVEAEASERATRSDDAERARRESAMREYERAVRTRSDELRALEEALRSHEAELERVHESLRPTERELAALEDRLRPEESRLQALEESLRPHARRLETRVEELHRRIAVEIRAIVEREARREGEGSASSIETASAALAH